MAIYTCQLGNTSLHGKSTRDDRDFRQMVDLSDMAGYTMSTKSEFTVLHLIQLTEKINSS